MDLLRQAALEKAEEQFSFFRSNREVIALAARVRKLILDTADAEEDYVNWRGLDLHEVGEDTDRPPLHAGTRELQEGSQRYSKRTAAWDAKREANGAKETALSIELGEVTQNRYPALAILWTGPVPDLLAASDKSSIQSQQRITGQIATLALFGKVSAFDLDSACRFTLRPGPYVHCENLPRYRQAFQDRIEDVSGSNAVGVWRWPKFHSQRAIEQQLRRLSLTPIQNEGLGIDLAG